MKVRRKGSREWNWGLKRGKGKENRNNKDKNKGRNDNKNENRKEERIICHSKDKKRIKREGIEVGIRI